MKGVTFNEQRAKQKTGSSLLLSFKTLPPSLSLTHASVRSLFWLQTKAALLGKKSLRQRGGCWAKRHQPRNEMCGGGRRGQILFSISRPGARRAKSEIESALRWGGQVWKRERIRQGVQSPVSPRMRCFQRWKLLFIEQPPQWKLPQQLPSPAAGEVEEQRPTLVLRVLWPPCSFKWRFGSGGLCDGSGKQAPAVLRPSLWKSWCVERCVIKKGENQVTKSGRLPAGFCQSHQIFYPY